MPLGVDMRPDGQWTDQQWLEFLLIQDMLDEEEDGEESRFWVVLPLGGGCASQCVLLVGAFLLPLLLTVLSWSVV